MPGLTERCERLLVSGLGLSIVFEYLRRYPPSSPSLSGLSFPQPEKAATAAITLALLLLVWILPDSFATLRGRPLPHQNSTGSTSSSVV